MKKRITAFAAAFVLAAGLLSGCGGSEKNVNNQEETQPQKGRYVEKEAALPEGIQNTEIFNMVKKDGKIVLYTKENQNGSIAIKNYTLEEDGTWTEAALEWVSALSIPYPEYGSCVVMEAADGTQYLCITFADAQREDNHVSHLYKSADGQTSEEVTPKDWLEMNEQYQYYETVVDAVLLEDGTLVAKYYGSTSLYDAATGEKKQDLESERYYQEKVYSMGSSFILLQSSDMGRLTGLDVYTPGKDTPDKTYTATQTSEGGTQVDVLEDGTIVLANGDGFYKAASGEDAIVNKVIEGNDTSFVDINMWCMSMKAIGDVYYALFNTSGTYTLMQYVYDPEAEILPTVELTLYTLFENSFLKRTAVLFHKEHPEVIINVETAVPLEQQYGGDYNLEDIRTQLNASLMAGKGPDIIIADGLSVDSLGEKGIFADITDIVKPLQESGELLDNIINACYGEDGKIYIVPLKFSMDMIVSKQIDADSMKDIKSLAETAANTQNSLFGSMTPEDLVKMFAPYFLSEIVDGKQLDKEALAEYLGYLKAIGNNTGIIQQYGENDYKKGIYDIAGNMEAAIYNTKGFLSAMDPLSAKKLVKGTSGSFENTFTPIAQAGINAKSEHVDIAREFIAFALSQKAQETDMYNGFPINAKALEIQKNQDRSDYGAVMTSDTGDGGYLEFTIEDYEAAEADRLLELCRNLDRPTMRDDKIEKEIILAMPAYLSGEKTVEETVSIIDDALRMYLAE